MILIKFTALDAAGPLFEDHSPSVRLDPSDAEFVDAIHTDGDQFYMVLIAEGGKPYLAGHSLSHYLLTVST